MRRDDAYEADLAVARRLVLVLVGWVAVLLIALVCASSAWSAPLGDAQRYRLTLKREAQRVWGLDAPVAVFAAQVHQESQWREAARSPVGAQGLAQFMPSTATWIGGVYPSLADRAPANPTWALRALVVYDAHLFVRVKADNDCQRMAYALSAYNGGLGWVYKRQDRSSKPGVCLGATCRINPGVSPASQRENERYPELILQRWQPLYRAWGGGMC